MRLRLTTGELKADFRAAYATAELRGLVGQEAWWAFPSRPALDELVVSAG